MNPQDLIVEHNIRTKIDVDTPEFKEFLASVKENGIVIPITYYVNGDGQKVVETGHRRLVAAQIVGISNIPAFRTVKTDDGQRVRRQLLENMHREDLNPLDMANALAELAKEMSHKEIASGLGMSEAWVSQHLKILTLSAPLRESVRDRKLGYRAAYEAASIPQNTQVEFADAITAAKTVRGIKQVKRSLEEIAQLPKQLTDVTPQKQEITPEPQPNEELLKILSLVEMGRDSIMLAKDLAHENGIDISTQLEKLRKEI